MPPKVLITSIS